MNSTSCDKRHHAPQMRMEWVGIYARATVEELADNLDGADIGLLSPRHAHPDRHCLARGAILDARDLADSRHDTGSQNACGRAPRRRQR